MAKKNSTKTATKEAMQASEPKMQVFAKWQGINISESPENWDTSTNDNSQTDLAPNFLLVQNNVVTTNTQALETRPKDSVLFYAPSGWDLTGVSYLKGSRLYLVAKRVDDYCILMHDISNPEEKRLHAFIPIKWKHRNQAGSVVEFTMTFMECEFTCIYSYLNDEEEHLVVLGRMVESQECNTFTGKLDSILTNGVSNAVEVSEPASKPVLLSHNVMPYTNARNFWQTMIDYAASLTDKTGASVRPASFGTPVYGGFMYSSDAASHSSMFDNMHWYIDEHGDMYFKRGTTLYQFDYTTNATRSGTSGYRYASWYKKLFSDKLTFDRAWVYKRYTEGSRVPSSVSAPNEWKVDPTNTNLTTPTSITKWANNPVYQSDTINVTDPDSGYETVFNIFKAHFDYTNDYVGWGVATNGDLWVVINLVRGATGSDIYIYQANAAEIDSIDPETVGVSDIFITYAYANRFGQTSLSSGTNIMYFSPAVGPVNWTSSLYVTLGFFNIPRDQDIEKINIYYTMDESSSPTFCGSIDVDPDNVQDCYTYDWFGASTDTDEWSDANMKPDSYNTTRGPDAKFCKMHDGRLYFWGSIDKPYRLIIGGNAGHELNISRGYGGAYIDIEPGIGTVVHGTYKWKTASGASIVTILCGNENTSAHKRFNLVENNITVSTELAEKSYMVEEIANTVGCQSDYGAGVWADGFYVLNRYGLTLTTLAMEYNTQIQSQLISDAVQPIFTDKLATIMENARMIHVDGKVYIVFGTTGDSDSLDRVVLCYDIGSKAWYTYTYGDNSTDVKHIMNIDYRGAVEGIGLICEDRVGFIPTTGTQEYAEANMVPFIIETGELSANKPTTTSTYVAQLEFRFDWFIGDMDIDVEGVDYYGRRVHVHKHIHTEDVMNDLVDWMRVNLIMENYHITFRGNAMFRMTHIVAKVYNQGNKIGLTRGFDSIQVYKNRRNGTSKVHHYIRNYANLRETLLT